MYINDTFHHKEQLDLDVSEDGLFESKFCEVAINKKYKILLSEIYSFKYWLKRIFRNFCTENEVC